MTAELASTLRVREPEDRLPFMAVRTDAAGDASIVARYEACAAGTRSGRLHASVCRARSCTSACASIDCLEP